MISEIVFPFTGEDVPILPLNPAPRGKEIFLWRENRQEKCGNVP
jgi:hypothetical protein